MRVPAHLLIPALLPLGLSACGPEPLEPVSPEAFEAQFGAALCSYMQRCPTPDLLYAVPPGLDCEAMFELSEMSGYTPIQEMVESGRVAYDGEAVSALLDDLRALPCDEALRAVTHSRMDRFLAGTVTPGGACYTDFDCVPGARCGGRACPGICEPLAPLGAACSYGNDCASGDCLEGSCVQRAGVGEPCETNGDCTEGTCGPGGVCRVGEADGADCSHGLDCASGYCRPPDANGNRVCGTPPPGVAPCDRDEHCPLTAPFCIPGRSVEYGGRTWTRYCGTLEEARTAEQGESCSPFGRVAPMCRAGLGCAPLEPGLHWQTRHECRPFVGPGEPCRRARPSLCPAGEYCAIASADALEGICQPLPTEGEPCASWDSPAMSDADLLYCAEGFECDRSGSFTCVRVREKGEPCEVDAACVTEQCGEDGVCTFDFCE